MVCLCVCQGHAWELEEERIYINYLWKWTKNKNSIDICILLQQVYWERTRGEWWFLYGWIHLKTKRKAFQLAEDLGFLISASVLFKIFGIQNTSSSPSIKNNLFYIFEIRNQSQHHTFQKLFACMKIYFFFC